MLRSQAVACRSVTPCPLAVHSHSHIHKSPASAVHPVSRALALRAVSDQGLGASEKGRLLMLGWVRQLVEGSSDHLPDAAHDVGIHPGGFLRSSGPAALCSQLLLLNLR